MSIQTSAVLVRLQISQFSNTRQDPAITDGVKALHKLSGKAGRWIKYKLPSESLDGIRKAASAARALHYDLTLHWEEGYGLLPIAARPRYTAAMEDARIEFMKAVDAFVDDYDGWIDQARLMHGATFNETDYPNRENIRNEFSLYTAHYPVPASSHFSSEMRHIYGAELEKENESKTQQVVSQAFNRLLEPIAKMAERLSGGENVFRDSLVENIRDMLDLIPALNVTGDPSITRLAQQIETNFGKLNAETLRTNKVVRRQAHEDAQNIITKFGSLGATRRFAV